LLACAHIHTHTCATGDVGVDFAAAQSSLETAVRGGDLHWRVASIVAHRGANALRESVERLAARCGRRSGSLAGSAAKGSSGSSSAGDDARVEALLLATAVHDWICCVVLDRPPLPSDACDDGAGQRLADGVLRAVVAGRY
jgi:hypothetical protein